MVFDSARRYGFKLFLVMATGEEAAFQDYADVICGRCVLDVFGAPDASAARFLELMQECLLDGIVTTREEAIPWVASISRRLGRPALTEHAAVACRDKSLMRSLLSGAALNQPQSEALTVDDALQRLATGRLKLPLVIKPRFGMGSLGVVKVDNAAELIQHYKDSVASATHALGVSVGSQPYFNPTLLIEEFIAGPEIVADTFSVDGTVRVLSLGYKGDAPGPYFERSVYEAPYDLPPAVNEAVRDQVERGLMAIGLRDGPSHTEIRLAGGVDPYIIEIAARVGGSGVSAFIVDQSIGVDVFMLQVLQACGLPISAEDTSTSRQCYAGNFVIPMQGHGEFVAYHGLREVRAHSATRLLVTFFEPGLNADPIPKFFGYPGFIMSQHDSAAQLRDYHDWLFRTVRVEWKPRR